MAKTASVKSDATVWTTVNFTSAAGKALKAKLTALNAEAKDVKAEIEALALQAIPAAPRGMEIRFSHRFGLGYAYMPKEAKAETKVKSGPSI